MNGTVALWMFPALIVCLLPGYPVAFTLGFVAMLFALLFAGGLDVFSLLPLRVWGFMNNFTLLAVPLFVFMGLVLNRSGLAAELIEYIGKICGRRAGGLALAAVLVGALLGATTGIVGATVVTLGVISLPVMLRYGYSETFAAGVVAASGTLGQIIPPSIILILLGDVMGIPVGRLFTAALLPGAVLVAAYLLMVLALSYWRPHIAPPLSSKDGGAGKSGSLVLLVPLLLMAMVLGSILLGVASPTEAAALGAAAAVALSFARGKLDAAGLSEVLVQSMRMTCMVFLLLIGATAFGLVFRTLNGDMAVHNILTGIISTPLQFMLLAMALIFILGMFLDFLEICFIVVPLLTPLAVHYGVSPLILAILIAVNLQSSFLTPPFGFSLFYLKGAVPSLRMQSLYKGVLPFIAIQLMLLATIIVFPETVLWLPDKLDAMRGL
ncbi:MAG: TRAP transporter large permease [Candidatus Porifericomitaceae bacterium WSBS_2022_MAG_OTU9]